MKQTSKTMSKYDRAGVDYSMSSPALCLGYDGAGPNDCLYFIFCDKKKVMPPSNIVAFSYPNWTTAEERFDKISSIFVEQILIYNVKTVAIEGYSYGSSGKIFEIAENCGVLKHKLWRAGTQIEVYAPQSIKKKATGSGRADKEQMYAAWRNEGGIDLQDIFAPKATKIGNPVSDIVDSYYIMKASM